MNKPFTASEVRDAARNYNGDTAAPLDMLRAFADLLEAQEIARNDAIEREYERENNPALSDAERLAEALRKIVDIDYVKRCCNNGIEVHYPDAPPEMECCGDPDVDFGPFAQIAMDALAAHSAQAQPPAASVQDWTDAQCVAFMATGLRHTEYKNGKSPTVEEIRQGARAAMFSARDASAKQLPDASVPDGLIDALRHQRQIDECGDEVGVSRQAVDEAIAILTMLAAQENPNG